jgi:hypothetical protein
MSLFFRPQAGDAQAHRQHLIEQARTAYAKKKADEAAGVSAKKGTGRESPCHVSKKGGRRRRGVVAPVTRGEDGIELGPV